MLRTLLLAFLLALCAPAEADRALGTASITSTSLSNCPNTSLERTRCLTIQVSGCGGAKFDGVDVANETVSGTAWITDDHATPIGTFVFFSGGWSTGYYFSSWPATVLPNAVARHQRVVQFAWTANGSYTSANGVGILAATCRTATLLRFLYDDASITQAGTPFGCFGQSGGATQCAYPLVFFGGKSFIDYVIFSSGPPISYLRLGHMGTRDPTWASQYQALSPWTGNPATILAKFGGECSIPDSAYGSHTWFCDDSATGGIDSPGTRDGVDRGDGDFVWPLVQCHGLGGTLDNSVAPVFGKKFMNALTCGRGNTYHVITQPGGSAGHTDVPKDGASVIDTILTNATTKFH